MYWAFSFSGNGIGVCYSGALIPILLVGTYCSIKTGKFSLAGHGRVNLMLSVTAAGGYIDWTYNDEHPEITTNSQAMKLYVNHMKSDPVEFLKQKVENLWELWGFFSIFFGRQPICIFQACNRYGKRFSCSIWFVWLVEKQKKFLCFCIPFAIPTVDNHSYFPTRHTKIHISYRTLYDPSGLLDVE